MPGVWVAGVAIHDHPQHCCGAFVLQLQLQSMDRRLSKMEASMDGLRPNQSLGPETCRLAGVLT
jgi:hypothetical protein